MYHGNVSSFQVEKCDVLASMVIYMQALMAIIVQLLR